MARFSFRGFVYVLIVMLGLLSAAPNILPQSIKQQLPTWYTTSTLSLCLDLQGGSHLCCSFALKGGIATAFTHVGNVSFVRGTFHVVVVFI